jgi:hypothetical protein
MAHCEGLLIRFRQEEYSCEGQVSLPQYALHCYIVSNHIVIS